MRVIDQNGSWLHQDSHEGHQAFPGTDTTHSSELAIEYDGSRYVDKVFRHEYCCPHVYFEELVFESTGHVEGKPP